MTQPEEKNQPKEMPTLAPRLGLDWAEQPAAGSSPDPFDAGRAEAIVPKPVDEDLEALDQAYAQQQPVAADEGAPVEAPPETDALTVNDEEEASQGSFNQHLVADLIEEGSVPEEAAPALDPQQRQVLLDQLQCVRRELKAATERLKAEPNREAPWYKEILAGAERALTSADDLVERLPKGDVELKAARLRMLDDYFTLTRLIDQREGRLETATAAIKPQRTAEQEAREAVRQLATRETEMAPEVRRRHVRLYVMATIAVLLLAGRMGLTAYRDAALAKQPTVEFVRDDRGIVAENVGGKETAEAVAKGAPVVSQVRLMQDARGNVRAIVFAVNPGGPPPRLVYRWFRDDALLKTEESGVIPADEIKDGAAYKVEVTAHDRGSVSPPLTTRPLVVLRRVSSSTE